MDAAATRWDSPAVRLTAAQRRRLQILANAENTTPQVRRRALIVLLSAAGQSGGAIAATLGVTRRTVSNTRARWKRGAVAGLQSAPRSGRPPRADATYIARLVAVVERDPREMGYAFTRWTAPRLAAYLCRETGVALSPVRVADLLRARRFVWRRTKRTIRNLQDPRAVARAWRRLEALKKKATERGACFELRFGDGVKFELLPVVAYAWRRRGHPLRIATPGSNRRVAVCGAMK